MAFHGIREKSSVHRFRPLPFQKPFMASTANIIVLTAQNQAGKTICQAVKNVRLLFGKERVQRWGNGPYIIYFASAKMDKVGEIWGRKLLRENPWDEWELTETCLGCPNADNLLKVCRHQDCLKGMQLWDRRRRIVPPLIPEGKIKGGYDAVSWWEKKSFIPYTIPLVGGHTLEFRSGDQEPLSTWQGIQFHRFNGDEELGANGRIMYGELLARLLRFHGQLIFNATPVGNFFHIRELRRRAAVTWTNEERVEGGGNDKEIESFIFRPQGGLEYFSKAARDFVHSQYARLETGERRARELGEPIEDERMAFPKWNRDMSVLDVDPCLEDATFYELVDPGWVDPCAVVFAASLPPRRDKEGALLKDEKGRVLDDPLQPRLYVWNLIYKSHLTLDDLEMEIRGIRGRCTPVAMYVDARGDQRRQETTETMLEGLQARFEPDGISVERGAWLKDVRDGIRALAALMEFGRLTMNISCDRLIREIEGFHRKWLQNDSSGHKETFAGADHAISALMAGVLRGLPWLSAEQRKGYRWKVEEKVLSAREHVNRLPKLRKSLHETIIPVETDRWMGRQGTMV